MSTRREFIGRTAAGIAAASMTPACSRNEEATVAISRTLGRRNSHVSTIKSVIRREETLLRLGGNGDNWHMSWAADDRQLVALCDGIGWATQPKELYNSRLLAIYGGPQDARFEEVTGYPECVYREKANRADTPGYYGYGTLALDGRIYQFLSTFNRSIFSSETEPLRVIGAKLIFSPDNGRTWCNQDGSTPVVWESSRQQSRYNMVFLREDQNAFSLLTVLQMGRNYGLNQDGYVYVYAPNGDAEGTMNELAMFRVKKNQILNRNAYEFFAGSGANGHPRWTPDITARGIVHTFPRGWVNSTLHPFAWQPSVVYDAPLGLYLMANWGTGSSADGAWFGKPSYLGFWAARDPWGPWTQIYEETAWAPAGDLNARAYQPQIAPKWIAPDGKSFWLVWTDFQYTSEFGMAVGAAFNARTHDEFLLHWMKARQHRPYYAFNTQRVDLDLA